MSSTRIEDESEEEQWNRVGDPRQAVWCSDHVCWREKCRRIHQEFSKRLAWAREQFKDVG